MTTLIICITLNVLIGLLFKFFGKFQIDTLQAIIVNYFTCLATAAFTLGETDFIYDLPSQPWIGYAAGMGIFFFIIFIFIVETVKHHGMMVTSTSQRLSLLFPAIAGLMFFNEPLSLFKIVGLIFTLLAVYYITYNKAEIGSAASHKGWFVILLPLLTYLGSSFVDLFLYLVDKLAVAPGAGLKYTAAMFLCAGIAGLCVLIYLVATGKRKLELKNLAAGILLGIPNFFSIYLVLVLLKEGWEGSVVFPLMNVAIILLSSLIGVAIFNEEMTKRKTIGFAFAIIATILLAVNF